MFILHLFFFYLRGSEIVRIIWWHFVHTQHMIYSLSVAYMTYCIHSLQYVTDKDVPWSSGKIQLWLNTIFFPRKVSEIKSKNTLVSFVYNLKNKSILIGNRFLKDNRWFSLSFWPEYIFLLFICIQLLTAWLLVRMWQAYIKIPWLHAWN